MLYTGLLVILIGVVGTFLNNKFYDYIISPEKEFILYSQSSHYRQFEEKEKFTEWIINKFSN